MDFLKYVLQKNNAQLTDEEILKEYFGIDGNKNNFKAETEVYFNMQTDWNNTITYHEEWGGLSGHWKKADITYERKVIVLRAAMEIDETATWTSVHGSTLLLFLCSISPHDVPFLIGEFWI